MTEKKLWNNFKSGDKLALEQIYRLYFKDLARYGRSLSKDENVVNDCIQDLFIELWDKRNNLADLESIKPYLFVSFRRRLFKSIRQVKTTTDTELQEYHFDVELSIDDLIIQGENASEIQMKLKSGFDQLPQRQKEILYLKYYSDLDYKEIADLMDLNYQSARNLASRAIKKLGSIFLILTVIMSKLFI